MPKANMYQSLHTTLMGPAGQPFEIQIRTKEMHKTAEYGIAAHWKYKESGDGKKNIAMQEEEKLSWLRQILEWQQNTDNREFLSLLKGGLDLFAEDVYCFTPNGDVKNLPNGSTPVSYTHLCFSKSKHGLVKGYLFGVLARYVFAVISGWLFFGEYAWDGWAALPYSLVYNGCYIFAEAALTVLVLSIPAVSKAMKKVKITAVN